MASTVIGIMTAIGLALATLDWGMDVWRAGSTEIDRSYAAAALEMLRERQDKAQQALEAARRQDDPVALAQAQVLRDGLALIEARYNPSAQVRQVEQSRAAFIEEGERKAAIDFGMRVLSSGVGGFGKVRGSYIRGTNWPPDPSKSVVLFDPTKAQAVRVMLDSDRPALQAIELADNLEDALSIVMSGYGVLDNAARTGDQPRTAGSTYEGVRQGLERMENLRPLPDTVGGYVAAALDRQVRAANRQIHGLPGEQQEAFVRDQACAQLREMWEQESDYAFRTKALEAAMARFECARTNPQAESERETEPEPETELRTEPRAEPETEPEAEPDSAMTFPARYLGTYTHTSGGCTDSGDFDLTLAADGTAWFRLRKTDDCSRGKVTWPSWQPGSAGMATHADGAFTLTFNIHLVVRGHYTAESMQGSGKSDTGTTYQVSGVRVPLDAPAP
jgi:hypothetical protein